jgi:O-antigen/teichoic acid export membrane protein
MLLNTIKLIFSRISINAINQLTFLISIPVLASRLDFVVFGQVGISFVIMQLSWAISEWGVENYSIEKWPKLKNQKRQFSFVSQIVSLNFIIALAFLILVFILVITDFLDIPLLFYYALLPGALFGSIYPLWFYQVRKIPQEMIFPTFFSRCLFLIIIFFIVDDNSSAYLALLAQGLSLFIIMLYAFIRIFTKYSFRWKFSKINDIAIIARSCFSYFINGFTNNQINTIWGFGLSIVSGPQAIALFNLGDQLYKAGAALSNIIAQSIRINFINKPRNQLKFTIIFFLLLYFLIATIIYLLSPHIVENLFSNNYLNAIPVLQIMIIAWAVNAIVKLLNYPILAASHGASWVNRVTKYFLFIHFIMFFLWSMFYEDVLTMAIMFTTVIIFQLITFIYYFINSHH